jgi:hypothetical protein
MGSYCVGSQEPDEHIESRAEDSKDQVANEDTKCNIENLTLSGCTLY